MKTQVSMKIEFNAGNSIENAFEDAIELANRVGCTMEFKFNDVTCLAYPGDNPKTGAEAYYDQLKRKLKYPIAITSK